VPRWIEAHLGSRDVARVIYGAIIGLSVILVQEAHPPAAGVVVGSLIATAIAVALAELYSDVVATETRTHRRVARAQLGEIGAGAAAVAFGVAVPVAFFVLAVAGAVELDTAFQLAKWSGLGLIGFYGFAAGRLAGASLLGCIVQALSAALIGALLIALKALVH
jgi:hypothetical protein